MLLSVAAADAAGGVGSQFTDPPTFGAPRNLALAGFTLLVILLIYRFFRGFLSTIAVLIGLIVGTAAGSAVRLHRLQPASATRTSSA